MLRSHFMTTNEQKINEFYETFGCLIGINIISLNKRTDKTLVTK